MAQTLTKPQIEIEDLLMEVADQQQTFDHNYGSALADLRRALVHQVLFTSAAGLVVGILLGTIVGARRR